MRCPAELLKLMKCAAKFAQKPTRNALYHVELEYLHVYVEDYRVTICATDSMKMIEISTEVPFYIENGLHLYRLAGDELIEDFESCNSYQLGKHHFERVIPENLSPEKLCGACGFDPVILGEVCAAIKTLGKHAQIWFQFNGTHATRFDVTGLPDGVTAVGCLMPLMRRQ